MDSSGAASASRSPTSNAVLNDMDNCHIRSDDDDDDNAEEDTLQARGAALAGPALRSRAADNGSHFSDLVSLRSDSEEQSDIPLPFPDTQLVDLNDADDEDEALPRSRRGQHQQRRSERRPSLDRMNGQTLSERRPSLDRMRNPASSERRPSLERTHQHQSDRRPSLDRRDNDNTSERRPSLERAADHRSERRPSVERANNYRLERRPSLERAEQRRQSPELSSRGGGGGPPSERRPSLERLEQYGLERRPSLDRKQDAAQRLQSLGGREDGDGSTQGINTLRPRPLNQQGIPCNWDMTCLPSMDTSELYRLVELSPADPEYSAVTVDFEEGGMKVKGSGMGLM